jgi:putative transposase
MSEAKEICSETKVSFFFYYCFNMFLKQHNGNIIRQAVLMYMDGNSYRKVAAALDIGKSSVHRWVHALHKVIGCQKRKKYVRKPKFPTLVADVKALFQSDRLQFCDLHTIQHALPYKVSKSWLRIAIRKARVSRRRFQNLKKIAGKKEPTERIHTFKDTVKNIPLEQIVCLDETGFLNHGNAIFGYFQMGKYPAVCKTPQREKVSCIMAISSSGVVHDHVQATPYNQASFLAFLDALAPKLQTHVKYILMDNVAFHRSKKVTDYLESKGLQILYIPPYSPNFNPIEEVFASLKRQFRKRYLVERIPFSESVTAAISYIRSSYDTLVHYVNCIPR